MQLSLPSQIGEMVRNEGSLGQLGVSRGSVPKVKRCSSGKQSDCSVVNWTGHEIPWPRSKGACLLNPQDKSSWLAKCHPVRMGNARHDWASQSDMESCRDEMKVSANRRRKMDEMSSQTRPRPIRCRDLAKPPLNSSRRDPPGPKQPYGRHACRRSATSVVGEYQRKCQI